jgi:hypothetical protein
VGGTHGSSPIFYAPGKLLFRGFFVFRMKFSSVAAVGHGESAWILTVADLLGPSRQENEHPLP